MDRLIVKNFGPLKDIDIKLNRVNLFIGENGSGKSVLAKLLIVLSKAYIFLSNNPEKDIIELINNLNINYLNNITHIIYYKDNDKIIEIKNLSISINYNSHYYLDINRYLDFLQIKPYERNIASIGNALEGYENKYIPAERSLISILNKSISTLIRYRVPISNILLEFASEYEYARETIKELNFLNVKYKNDGTDKIYYDEKNYLDLEYSSSGIQSALPLYLTMKNFIINYAYGIIIEEPEQNLFPKAQYEVVKFIIEQISKEDVNIFLMTHSPYILTALNNLILANEVLQKKGEEAIKGIVDKDSCIAFEDVSAYSIEDGKAVDIMNKENRLIGINIIDNISDEIDETFNKLLEKLD